MGKDTDGRVDKFETLRRKAEARLGPDRADTNLSAIEIRKILQELHTHQIELELQNEDLRQTQAELRLARQRFSDLYDFAPVGYLTISDKGLILEANLTAADLLGVARGQLLGQSFSAFIASEDSDTYYLGRKKLLETSESQNYELQLRKRDGARFDAQVKSTISAYIDGSSGQFRMTITDISEQKKLASALQRSKSEWEMTFDAIGDLITILDQDFRVVRANKATHRFFQTKPEELHGRACYELFRGETGPCQQCPLAGLPGDQARHCEILVHRDQGRIYQVNTDPVLSPAGELQYLVHIARDITETKAMEEQLFQSYKMEAIGTMAGGIAHDFNNILTAILGYAQFIKEDNPGSGKLQKDIDQVLIAGNRAKELVKQILLFSRKGQGLKKRPLQPQPLVKEVCKMLRATLPATIKIEETIAPDCDVIEIDPTNFHQVVMNLCTNAFHACPNEMGTISVELSNKTLGPDDVAAAPAVLPGPFVELQVRDTGCGIDNNMVKRIFEPYFTTKAIGKGSGMGLALVHGIVKGCGGLIKVASDGEHGSTFKIYFPAVRRTEAAPQEKIKAEIPGGTERIMAVDDEVVLVDYLKSSLERLGYRVTSHTSSVEAMEDFNARPDEFDLVITDQTMPEMTGVELTRQLLLRRPDIPVILDTGYSNLISAEEAKRVGIKRFLLKPVALADLAKNVRDVLDERPKR